MDRIKDAAWLVVGCGVFLAIGKSLVDDLHDTFGPSHPPMAAPQPSHQDLAVSDSNAARYSGRLTSYREAPVDLKPRDLWQASWACSGQPLRSVCCGSTSVGERTAQNGYRPSTPRTRSRSNDRSQGGPVSSFNCMDGGLRRS